MTKIDIEAFQKQGFSFEEIESIKRGLDDVENGRTYTEEEFYSRLEKRLFSKNKTNV
jgi:predicted transcriptional regulator